MLRWGTRFVAIAAGALLSCAPALAETAKVTFVLVNDVDQMSESNGRGGYARIAAVIKGERAARENVVFVHAGDAISPSLLSGFDQGAHIIALLNMTPPDVFVPGNHEFDFGPDIFRKRMSEARFPLLAANLRDAPGQRLPGFEDSRLLEFGGVKIGIVGLTAEDSHVKSSPGDLKIEPVVATGIREAEALRKSGAHFVVGVAHAARSLDRELFDSRGFDLLLSGDDHDLLVQFDGRTALVESLSQGEYVTAIDLTIETDDRNGRSEATWWPEFRIIDSADVQPDTEVEQKVAGFEAEFSRELDVVIGRTGTELDSRRSTIRTGEAAIGNLIADAMRQTVGAEIGLMNSGGIRADKRYPAGRDISRKDILAELPFGNRVVKLEVRGDVLRSALENGFSQVEDGSGRFPQVSGMVVEADLKAPKGARVKSVTINGAPLDPAQTYTVATVDFLTKGGDGYGMLVDAPRILNERDGPLLAAAVMAHIRKRGEVSPSLEGRIKITR